MMTSVSIAKTVDVRQTANSCIRVAVRFESLQETRSARVQFISLAYFFASTTCRGEGQTGYGGL